MNQSKIYRDYLNSPAWAIKRQAVYARVRRRYSRMICERCGEKPDGPPHVHHTHYRTFLTEDTEDDTLVLLCGYCHPIEDENRKNGIAFRRFDDVYGFPAPKKVLFEPIEITNVEYFNPAYADDWGDIESYLQS